MGGGFYDRYSKEHTSALYIGVCYAFQMTSDLPFDDMDMTVDILLPVSLDDGDEED